MGLNLLEILCFLTQNKIDNIDENKKLSHGMYSLRPGNPNLQKITGL